MVFANKCDEDPEDLQVTDEDIKRFEETHKNIPVVKTSAKLGTNVDDSFLELTKKLIIDKNKNGGGDDSKKRMGLAFKKLQLGEKNGDTSGGSGGGCC